MQVPLYGLTSGGEGLDEASRGVEWRYKVDHAIPQIACCLAPGASVRFRTMLQGRVRFSAALSLWGGGTPGSNSIEITIAVCTMGGGPRRQGIRPIMAKTRAGEESRADWNVPLGRFRGELVEIVLSAAALRMEMAGVCVVVGNPIISLEPPFWEILARVGRKAWSTVWAEGMAGVLCELAGAVDPEWGRGLRYRFWSEGKKAAPRGGASSQPDGQGSAALRIRFSFLIQVRADALRARLLRLLDSIIGQRGESWEILAVVDPAADPTILTALRRRASGQEIRLIGGGGDWAQALNSGLAQAAGTFVALVAPEGELATEALARVTAFLNCHPEADIIYSDEDRRDGRGRRREPFFKPDWSPDYFLSYPYLGQLCVYRRTLVQAVGGFRSGIRGAEDYDLLLRLQARARVIHHLPEILWDRFSEPAPKPLPFARNEALDRLVLGQYLKKTGAAAEVVPGLVPGTHRVRWRIQGSPLVSIVIPTRDRVHLLRRCLTGIRERTAYPNVEVVIVDNGSVDPAAREYLARCGAHIVRDPGPFNFARLCNVGAGHAAGAHLLFLNNDTEPWFEDWLGAMLEHSQRERVGAVGAKLYYPDGRIQHVGIVIGINGIAAQVFRGAPGDHPGYFGRAFTIHECSAVTGACLMTRREVFETLGGFDEGFPVNFNDVDYCLRVRERGYRVVFTPFARLFHHEFATRQRDEWPPEAGSFRRRWLESAGRDPYYSPNLSLRHADYSVRL